jgi:AraC family transcriptional regulator, transcriptional activator of the genes for pyochelin and ferripyochelin receptors
LRSSHRHADFEKLFALRDFVENNYLEPLSLAGLCKMFSLNEFKLKKGYKELFHTTVFGHINALRMDKAREFLLHRQMSISEIADFIGYKNIGSFSAEFKRRFGFPPSTFRR